MGEDDLEPGLVPGHAALAVGEVAAVAEPEPGRRHGGAALGAAHPGRGRLRLHGAGQPPRQRTKHGRGRRGGHRRAAALGRGLLVPHLRHRRHPHGVDVDPADGWPVVAVPCAGRKQETERWRVGVAARSTCRGRDI